MYIYIYIHIYIYTYIHTYMYTHILIYILLTGTARTKIQNKMKKSKGNSYIMGRVRWANSRGG